MALVGAEILPVLIITNGDIEAEVSGPPGVSSRVADGLEVANILGESTIDEDLEAISRFRHERRLVLVP